MFQKAITSRNSSRSTKKSSQQPGSLPGLNHSPNKQQPQEHLLTQLRIVTAGSVDDGKSTLIGRLLYDANAIPADQLSAISSQNNEVNFAQLTDGLRAERQQGITIDVAYRYWQSARRKFIVADSPGHSQYTRNMVTAASNSELALLVVDCRNGLLEQTRRHVYLASLLGLRHIVVCVNKMDLVAFDEEIFNRIREAVLSFSTTLGEAQLLFIPVSALHGDNIVYKSQRTPWYSGPALLDYLEQVPSTQARHVLPSRFSVQLVIRDEETEFRGYAGQIASGRLATGDEIIVFPSRHRTRIKSIRTYDGALAEASAPGSVILEVDDHLDIGRGDVIAEAGKPPSSSNILKAIVCWMDDHPSSTDRKYFLKHGSLIVKAKINQVLTRTNIETFQEEILAPAEQEASLVLNQIGAVAIQTSGSVSFDPYRENRHTGSFILIDAQTHATAAAGMLLPA